MGNIDSRPVCARHDSQPSGLGCEYCASHVRFRVFQQTARASRRIVGAEANSLQTDAEAGWGRTLSSGTTRPPLANPAADRILPLVGAVPFAQRIAVVI